MSYSCNIIVQDKKVRRTLGLFFNFFPQYDIKYIVGNEDEILNGILKHPSHLLVIDLDNAIERPFEFLEEARRYYKTSPKVIGISSSKEYAYEAIKHGFYDYLLKPVKELELRKVLMRNEKKSSNEKPERLCLKSYSDYQYLSLNHIVLLKADNNTTDIYLKDGKKVTAFKTLKHFENYLPNSFFRIHNSYIVNKEAVQRINFGKSWIMVHGTNSPDSIPFSRSYRKNVDELKKILSQSDIRV